MGRHILPARTSTSNDRQTNTRIGGTQSMTARHAASARQTTAALLGNRGRRTEIPDANPGAAADAAFGPDAVPPAQLKTVDGKVAAQIASKSSKHLSY